MGERASSAQRSPLDLDAQVFVPTHVRVGVSQSELFKEVQHLDVRCVHEGKEIVTSCSRCTRSRACCSRQWCLRSCEHERSRRTDDRSVRTNTVKDYDTKSYHTSDLEITIMVLNNNNANGAFFCTCAYPAQYPEDTRSTQIS